VPGLPIEINGQTGRTFSVRYKEYIRAIRSNSSNSGYSNHILNTGHTYGTITGTVDVIRTGRKGRHLNILEKYHIYTISRNSLHINDTSKHTILYSKQYMNFTIGSSTYAT
jgi:hypothetical protein